MRYLILIAVVFSLSACSGKDGEPTATVPPTATTVPTQAPVPTTTPDVLADYGRFMNSTIDDVMMERDAVAALIDRDDVWSEAWVREMKIGLLNIQAIQRAWADQTVFPPARYVELDNALDAGLSSVSLAATLMDSSVDFKDTEGFNRYAVEMNAAFARLAANVQLALDRLS